jgi:hypothetical protein
MTESSSQAGADGASGKEPAASTLPTRGGSLWVLERADNLLGEVAAAMWLSVASVWRIPRAAVARDSMDRLEALVAGRRVLPPRLSLLVASIASPLLLSWVAKGMPATGALLERLATTSPENWLVVAAPALVSLWLAVIALGALLHRAAGAGSLEPSSVLMQVISGVTILSCLGIFVVIYSETYLGTVRRGLPDLVILTGFWMLMAFLAVAGVRCAQQMTASSGCSRWRRRVVLVVVGPLAFVSAAVVAPIATYWLLQVQGLVTRVITEGALGEPPSNPSALSPTCYAMDESVVCQVLLSTRSDLALGAIQQVDIEWHDVRGRSAKVSLRPQASQILQLAPRVEPGGFWILRAKEPLPFAFQIATPDACRLHEQIADFRRRVEPMPGLPPLVDVQVTFTISWRPGFGLVPRKDAAVLYLHARTEEWDPNTSVFDRTAVLVDFFDTGFASLCEKRQ